MSQYDPLRQFCTVRQLEYLDALDQHGSVRKAATALGINARNLFEAIATIRRKAAMQGHSPAHDMTRTVPEPYVVRGVSTYYNKDGKPAGQWVKSSLDDDKRMAAIRAAVEAMADDVPRVEPTALPVFSAPHLMNLYVLTDSHVGMLAWHKEGGADWDLRIAEQTLSGCFAHLIESSPKADSCLIAQLGDFLHYDGMTPVTPTSGHVLDADGRFAKVVQVAVRTLRRVVDMALHRHKTVHVLMAEGNHDIASSVWLRALFRAMYETEPRVIVIDSELPYYVHRHGRTMLGLHHGHLKKLDDLPILFASQFPEVWGATTKRYGHVGHWHHRRELEAGGIVMTQHPTLAARDAYAARGGWIAERQISSTTYHTEFGQVGKITVTPEMVGL